MLGGDRWPVRSSGTSGRGYLRGAYHPVACGSLLPLSSRAAFSAEAAFPAHLAKPAPLSRR